MLTIEKLKEMPIGIFDSGTVSDNSIGINISDSGELLRWVAVRGGIHDWAIYHSMDANFISANYLDDPAHLEVSEESIARSGAKLHKEEDIKKGKLFKNCPETPKSRRG